MKYQDFQQLINNYNCPQGNDDLELLIPVTRGHPAVGPTHTASPVSLRTGSDWNKGVVFIDTSEPLAVLDEETKIALAFWRNLIESYWRASSHGTLEDFYFLLGKKFDEALEKSGKKVKIEETIARAKYLQQKANEARNKANK